MELHLNLDDKFLQDLQKKLGTDNTTDMVRDALTLLQWAVEESRRGRVIVSSDEDGQNLSRVAMPSLDRIPK